MTGKKILIGSFHSCSYYALDDSDHDLIVSFDSHIDTNATGSDDDVCRAIGDRPGIRYAAGRAAAHTMLRKKFPSAKFLIVTSAVGLETQAAYMRNNIRERVRSNSTGFDFGSGGMFGDHIRDKSELIGRYLKLLKDATDIHILTCPPSDPVGLSMAIKGFRSPLIDIDVDYFAAMQAECYTPLVGTEPHQLGNIERVLRLIRGTKPETITLSEATADSLGNPGSRSNYLVNRLKNMGYEVEKFFLFDSDEQARASIKAWDDFGVSARENVTAKYWNDGPPDLGNARQMASDIAEYAKQYFSSLP